MLELFITVGSIILLLIISAFFSGSETALTAASHAQIHRLAEGGNKRARLVNKLRQNKEMLIGSILLGNNFVNILISSLATSFLIIQFGESGVAIATGVTTVLVVIFGEVLPKSYAINHSLRFALRCAPLIQFILLILRPFTRVINALNIGLFKLLRIPAKPTFSHELHEEELRGIIDLHKGENPEIHHERMMLRSILDLADVPVSDVMRHRKDVFMLDVTEPTKTLIDKILKSQYTRIPLTRGDDEDIIGVLHVRNLLRAIAKKTGKTQDIDIQALAIPPWFIPDSTTLLDQLHAFRRRHEHFAIVVDEYGDFQGVVTLEDILEEIVGDIADEYDTRRRSGIQVQPDGSLLVEGTVTIRDLNRQFEWRLPDEDATTIAGLIIQESRQIPNPGQVFEFYGFRFEILRRERNQISLIRITRV